jgi:hypothetical protein
MLDASGMPGQMVLAVIAVTASAQYFRHHADDGTQGPICPRSWQAAPDLFGLSGIPSRRRLWRLVWIVTGWCFTLIILKIWLCQFVTPLVAISDVERTREDLFLLRLFYVETGNLSEYIRIRRRFGGKITAGVCLEVDRRLHGVSTCDNQTGQAGSRQGIEGSIP